MSDDKEYKDGDIVWVKFGNNWWPAEVTDVQRQPEGLLNHLKRKPYCVVKFFQEDAYEYVKSSKQIYPFQCHKKDEFIKKGVALFEAKNKFMEKFPSYVETAESLTVSAKSSPSKPTVDVTELLNNRPADSIVKAVVSRNIDKKIPNARSATSAATATSIFSGKARRHSITILNISQSTPLRTATTSASSLLTSTPNNKTPSKHATNTVETPTTSKTPLNSSSYNSSVYMCNLCDFTSTRQNVMIFHRKSHASTTTTTTPPAKSTSATKTTTIIPKVTNDSSRVQKVNTKTPIKPTISTIQSPIKTSVVESTLTKTAKKDEKLASEIATKSLKTVVNQNEEIARSSDTMIEVRKDDKANDDDVDNEDDEKHNEKEEEIPKRRNLRRSKLMTNKKSTKITTNKNERKEAIKKIATNDNDSNNSDGDDISTWTIDTKTLTPTISDATTNSSMKTIITITSPTSATTPTIGTSTGNSEDLRQRLLADWSDEENIDDHNHHHHNHANYKHHHKNNGSTKYNKSNTDNANGANDDKEETMHQVDDFLIDKVTVAGVDDDNANNLKMGNTNKPETPIGVSDGGAVNVDIAVDDNEKKNNNNNNKSNKKSMTRIRNIPKKDRRDVILTEFNERTSAAAVAVATTTTTKCNSASTGIASIVQIDMLSNSSSDSVVIVSESPAPAPIAVIEENKLEHRDDAGSDDANIGATSTDETKKIENIEEQETKPEENNKTINNSVDSTPTKVLSCFDFQDEDDEENRENDMLKSIANFKKKLQLSENNLNSTNNQKTTMATVCNDRVDGDDNDTNVNVTVDRDLQLVAEIESLLQQTSSTVSDVGRLSESSTKEDLVVGGKSLPIKERGKRIFKSRNHSRTEIINQPDIVEQPLDEKVSDEDKLLSTNGEPMPKKVEKEKENTKDLKEIPVQMEEVTTTDVNATPTDGNSSLSEADAEFGSPTSMLSDERLPTANEPKSQIKTAKHKNEKKIEMADIIDDGRGDEDVDESLPHEELPVKDVEKPQLKTLEIGDKKRGHIKYMPRRQLNKKVLDYIHNATKTTTSNANNNHNNNEAQVKPITINKKSSSSGENHEKDQKECLAVVRRSKLSATDEPMAIDEEIITKEASSTVDEPVESPKTKTNITSSTEAGGVSFGAKRCEVVLRKTKIQHSPSQHHENSLEEFKDDIDATDVDKKEEETAKLSMIKSTKGDGTSIKEIGPETPNNNDVVCNILDIQSMPLLAEQQQKESTKIIPKESINYSKGEDVLPTTTTNAKKGRTIPTTTTTTGIEKSKSPQLVPTKRKSSPAKSLKNVEESPQVPKKMTRNEPAQKQQQEQPPKETTPTKTHDLNNKEKSEQKITSSSSTAAAAATGGHKQSGSIALASSHQNKLNSNSMNYKNSNIQNKNHHDLKSAITTKVGGAVKRKLATREPKLVDNNETDEIPSAKMAKTLETSNLKVAPKQQQQTSLIKPQQQNKSNNNNASKKVQQTPPLPLPSPSLHTQSPPPPPPRTPTPPGSEQENEEEEVVEEAEKLDEQKLDNEEVDEDTTTTTTSTPPAIKTTLTTFELDEQQSQQLLQIPNEESETPKILAVPTQPIPGYNETFLLCTFVNNEYKPIDNVPLYLDNELNQLVPLPAEALVGQPELVVNQPPPQNDDELPQQQQQQSIFKASLATTSSNTSAAESLFDGSPETTAQLLEVAGVNVSTVMTPAVVSTNHAIITDVTEITSEATLDDSMLVDDAAAVATTATSNKNIVTGDMSEHDFEAEIDEDMNANDMIEMDEVMLTEEDLPSSSTEAEQQIVADNAIILNIEGQQIIIDAATFAQLLANPDANTQLITDDGTEFVLTREVLAALESQQAEAQHGLLQPEGGALAAASPSSDILAVALAGTDLYGSDILEIETSQGLQLVCSDGSLAFPPGSHLTPPITAQTSETNALLDQTPIMSALETPTSLAGCGNSKLLQLTPTTAAELLAAGEEELITPNLEDSLAVIGVTGQGSSLDLPITITNPAIAPKVNLPAVLPVTDAIMQFPVQPSVGLISTYSSDHHHTS